MKRISVCWLLFVLLYSPLLGQNNAGSLYPPKRAHHHLVYDEANRLILMTGGSTPLDEGKSGMMFNDIWSYDGKGWKSLGTAGDKRSGMALAYDSKRKKLYSFGGWSDGNSLAELRVMENGDWVTLSNHSEMKASEPGLVYDVARDRLVTFGGSPGMGLVKSTTWEWDGTAWKKFEGVGPDGRQAFAMVYDDKRKRTVLYGGMGTSFDQTFGDTWVFDGSSWTKVADTGPGPRTSPGYTYDSKRGLFILFGGNSKGIVGDTWAWDGEWKKLADTGPPARAMGHLAYDKHRDRVILFGGRLGWPRDADDTWEWDGKQWNEIR